MGVQGLWSLVGPAARPTQLESMRQKRVAVDASIWIHQFMRTMRDKEGNALRNGHLMGFFRRICKLLFFDIKPVFVFDGGAPTLKRSTIRERRKRREGVKENLKVTAKKILSAQVKSRVLYQEELKLHGGDQAAAKDQEYIYYDAAKDVLSKKRKLDQFELPEVDSIENRINKLDPRLSTHQEIRDFVNEFDPNELDIDSEAFFALPPEVQYEVIQDMMWKSRSTSWARLDEMVRGSKTALDFSKQQIKLLKHRNKMSQRLMQANNASSGTKVESTRVAGERGRQYVLFKNEDISQGLGWKLPGLSAAEPVDLDPTPTTESTRPEPKLEVPDGSDFKSTEKEPTDKVAAAMAANPKLAALFDGLLSEDDDDDDEEEVEMEDIVTESRQEDQPLFESNNGIVDDMGAYVVDGDDDDDDDAAINQVISRIYDTDYLPQDTFEEIDQDNDGALLSLSADDFYNLWLSRVPDAFLYLHSFNDEYKSILRRAVDETNPDQLKKSLQSVRKQFGKTNEGDELTLEALKFQESFLESTHRWREQRGNTEQAVIRSPPAFPATDENIILDDDDDEEEEGIQFVDASTAKVDAHTDNEAPNASDHVHLDIQQSSLHSTAPVTQVVEPVNNNSNNNIEENASSIASSQSDNAEAVSQHALSQESATANIPHTEPISNETASNDPVTAEDAPVEAAAPTAAARVDLVDHGYNSEDEAPDVQGEEDEYARFVSDIASKKLEDVRTELYKDLKELNRQQRKELGNSEDITDQMVRDIQELLKLFGIPYLVSPMEAEAQCATLEALKLVDGTVTDDSDVFLFGASRVYKNMFNQQRYVECYLAQDVEREMLLTRKKLIQLAFLLGSDYTEGIPGVGPVAAMEILSEFSGTKAGEDDGQDEAEDDDEEEEPLEAPLKRFKEWYNSGVDATPFQKKFRKRHDALDIPDDFPNPLVIAAYYHPTVDDSNQKFVWGQPQLDSLRIFLTEAFGWSEEKADQVLLPVLREMNSRKSNGEQATIGSFFGVTGTVSSGGAATQGNKHSSKRVRNIVDNWRKKQKRGKKSN